MIVCRKCGYRNADDDTFCGTCGGFLEWTGEKQQAAALAPVAEPEPAPSTPPPPRAGFLQRVFEGANAVIAGPRPATGETAAPAAPAKPGLPVPPVAKAAPA